MITNFDVQQILNNTTKLKQVLFEDLKDVKPGSGETTIHLYAYKQLLEEIAFTRSFNK